MRLDVPLVASGQSGIRTQVAMLAEERRIIGAWMTNACGCGEQFRIGAGSDIVAERVAKRLREGSLFWRSARVQCLCARKNLSGRTRSETQQAQYLLEPARAQP